MKVQDTFFFFSKLVRFKVIKAWSWSHVSLRSLIDIQYRRRRGRFTSRAASASANYSPALFLYLTLCLAQLLEWMRRHTRSPTYRNSYVTSIDALIRSMKNSSVLFYQHHFDQWMLMLFNYIILKKYCNKHIYHYIHSVQCVQVCAK